MDGEDPHRVVVGLGQHGLDDARTLAARPARPRRGSRGGCRRRLRRTRGPARSRSARVASRSRGRPWANPTSSTPRARARRGRAARWVTTTAGRRATPRAPGSRRRPGWSGGQRVGERVLVVPPAAVLRLVREEVVVTAAEHRRPQRAHQRELVGGVVDGLQHHEQVADLPRAVDERRRLRPVGDAGGVERVLELAERRARREAGCRCRRVGTARTARCRRRRAARPASPRAAHDRRPPRRRPPRARAARRPSASRARGWRRGARPARPPATRVAHGLERDVLGLRLRLGHDELAEHVVDEVDHRPGGAEVAGEPAGRRAERRPGPEERGDVGAAEAVDRLLRVTDHEQPAGVDRELVPAVARGRRARPTRGARRDRTGSGRCPGTRRAAGGCTAARRRRRTSHPWSGSRSTARASTRRSWNSSSPRRRRAGGLAQGELRQLPGQPAHDELGDVRARGGRATSSRSAFTSVADRRRPGTRWASCPCDRA